MTVGPKSGKVMDEVDDPLGEDEEIERDFEEWLKGWKVKEEGRRTINGGSGWSSSREVASPAGGGAGVETDVVDSFSVMDNLSYTGETGMGNQHFTAEEKEVLRSTLSMWDDDDTSRQYREAGMEGRGKGGKGEVWGVRVRFGTTPTGPSSRGSGREGRSG
jgi:hypothetical protein